MQRRRARKTASIFRILSICFLGIAASLSAAMGQSHIRAAILGGLPPVTDSREADTIASEFKKQGSQAFILTAEQVADPQSFSAERYDVLVVPHAATFPAIAQDNLLRYLHERGKLICIGAPAFSRYVFADDGKWYTRENLMAALKSTPLPDVGAADVTSWSRATNDTKAISTVDKEESPHGPALHLRFENYTNWDNFGPKPFDDSPYAPGAQVLTFWAKGGPHTSALVIEWVERDGSRWIGSVTLTPQWKRYAMAETDFHYWQDSSSHGRGGSDDRFHPENAHSLRIGLAQSHALLATGKHEYWIADLGSAALPETYRPVTPPVLEALSPSYKGFVDKDHNNSWAPTLRQLGRGSAETSGRLTIDAAMVGGGPWVHPRMVWYYTSVAGDMKGASWGGVIERPAQNRETAAVELARYLTDRVAVVWAGAESPSYFSDQPVVIGARVYNPRRSAVTVRCEVTFLGQHKANIRKSESMRLNPGESRVFRVAVGKLPPRGYVAQVATLLPAEKHPDVIPASFLVIAPPEPSAKANHYVRVKGGEFVLDGKPWRIAGINFWPAWIAGQDAEAYRHHWLSSDEYDPALAERDLETCTTLGVNMVSVMYSRPEMAPALNDFLARCRNHGIKANVFLEGANPLNYNLQYLKQLVDAARLRGNDAVFAFDIAWEPTLGRHADRKRLDTEWRQWVVDQYGSIENAEKNWGIEAPRENGEATNPTDEQVSIDGPARVMVAAYRRFADDRISIGYRHVAKLLRSYRPLIGARSGYGGNGNPWALAIMPFDLLSGAAHLDFISAEGYYLDGPWQKFREGGLNVAYGRYAGNGKPVFWAEFGQSVFPDTTPEKMKMQGEYYAKFYRSVADSGANGSAAWWFPGGLRVDENSDYGIVSPDGTPRPAALQLQKHARELPKLAVNPAPNAWITIDRDADSQGYVGVYSRWREQYGKLREAGKVPGVRTKGSGTTTANMPLVAVGNVPANGQNPLKYVDGEIDVDAKAGIVTLINTGDAKWLKAGNGRVAVGRFEAGVLSATTPIPSDTARYGTVRMPLSRFVGGGRSQDTTLRLVLLGRESARLPFGETARIRE